MRICSPQIGLSSTATLGGAVYDYEILNRLAALGVVIDIPHLLPGDAVPRDGFHFHTIGLKRLYRLDALITNAAFAVKLRSVVSEHRPDLVRIAYPWYSGVAGIDAGRRFDLPTVVAFHHLEERESWLERNVHSRVARHATAIHVGSRFAAGQLVERYGVPEAKVSVIPYAVSGTYVRDETARASERAARGLDGRIVLLHVGSLIARKNLLFLVEVFEAIEHDPPPLLLLAGAGYPKDNYEKRLRERIAASRARERIRLLGRVDESEKRKLYHACDILVHPARVEGFGLSVGEAMACGRAVVAARAGSLPEIVDEGKTGLLASPDDAEAFRDAVVRLIEDEALRRELGARAAAAIPERFSWDRTARETLALYEKVVR